MDAYQIGAIEGASGLELTVAVYEGNIRFMNHDIETVTRGNQKKRREKCKRKMDMVIDLKATLNMEKGGEPAKALTEFYVAMFALMLQGSQANSREKFEQVIACVRNVRGAWRQVANNSEVNPIPVQVSGLPSIHMQPGFENANSSMSSAACASWSA
jgi:flagellar protein FliS